MKVDKKLIEHLEALAQIELKDDEREKLTKQLGRIVGFVEKLQSVDTTGVAPASFTWRVDEERLRDDEPETGLDRDVVLGQAPDQTNGYFRVPRVLGPDESR